MQGIANEQARRYVRSLGVKPKIPFQQIFPNASPQALDLLSKMLEFNPAKRCTVEQALYHPFMESLHDAATEPRAHAPFSFDFEKWTGSKEFYQGLIWQEMLSYHPEAALEEGPFYMPNNFTPLIGTSTRSLDPSMDDFSNMNWN